MVSQTAKTAVFSQETDEIFLSLLEISHESLAQPIRVVNNTQNIVSNGNTYIGYPFEMTIPDDADQIPRVTAKIDNVDRMIIDSLRAISTPPTYKMSMVLASNPDVIEMGPYEMVLTEVMYDATTITATLMFDNVLDEPFPGDSYTPSQYPGLF